jgi:hypothetical protein
LRVIEQVVDRLGAWHASFEELPQAQSRYVGEGGFNSGIDSDENEA